MAGQAKLITDDSDNDRSSLATLVISGTWKITGKHSKLSDVLNLVDSTKSLKKISLDCQNLNKWDSSLVIFLKKFIDHCTGKNIEIDHNDVPTGIRKLIAMADTSLEAPKVLSKRPGWIQRLKDCCFKVVSNAHNLAYFTGQIFGGIFGLICGKISLRAREFKPLLEETGARALPIVSLISFLVGLIIAFVSIVQLKQFGASIYVANLVGIAMMREMGCIMTGVIMSGRTGAAFAATIGSMKVNDEVDALQTTGIDPIVFLVLPRVLALTLMMPILATFSAFIGTMGGLFTTLIMTDISVNRYWLQTIGAVRLSDFLIGVFKSIIFGLLIARTGCAKGIQSGQSAEDVGDATTSAVVSSITSIIIADAVFAIFFAAIGI